MDYNYHTHTRRCGHAVGEMEEYVRCAIDGGLRKLGFSEHIPVPFPGGYESSYRLKAKETPDYFREAHMLREKYASEIDLAVGYEMEYYPAYFADTLRVARNAGCEYLILGQHFIYNELPAEVHATRIGENVEELREYVRCVVQAVETGLFSIIAHPDLAYFTGPAEVYLAEMEPIFRVSRETGVPLEINFLGIRDGRSYPRRDFWEAAARYGSPVTFGCDAHAPQDTCDKASLAIARQMVRDLGLNYVGCPTLRPI